jgi:hypothetical protein
VSQTDSKRECSQERQQKHVAVLEEHPPAQLLRQEPAEAAAVLDREPTRERLHGERRPRDRYQHAGETDRLRGAERQPPREQKPERDEQLDDWQAELRGRHEGAEQVVGLERRPELVEARKLAGGHRAQEQPIEERSDRRAPERSRVGAHA